LDIDSRIRICPFCPDEEGFLGVDHEWCVELRADDPDPHYLSPERIEDGQRVLLFDPPREPNRPCPHVLILQGQVGWRYLEHEHTVKELEDLPRATWGINFEWTSSRLFRPQLDHTRQWFSDFDRFHQLSPSLVPDTPFEWDAVSEWWHPTAGRHRDRSVYDVFVHRLVAERPGEFLRQVCDLAHVWNKHMAKVRARWGV
jgi:hypothetical protein